MAGSRVLVGLVAACSLVAGAGLGRWLLEDRPVSLKAAPSAPPAEPARLEPLLSELADALRALTRALEQSARPSASPPSPPSPASAREPVATGAPAVQDSTELAAALQALASAIRELRTAPATVQRDAPEELAAPAWVDREGAFAATGMRRAAQVGTEEAWARGESVLRLKFLFKTGQQVLSTFGVPDEIDLEENCRYWHYRNRFEGGEEQFSFGFDEGVVFYVGYDLD